MRSYCWKLSNFLVINVELGKRIKTPFLAIELLHELKINPVDCFGLDLFVENVFIWDGM